MLADATPDHRPSRDRHRAGGDSGCDRCTACERQLCRRRGAHRRIRSRSRHQRRCDRRDRRACTLADWRRPLSVVQLDRPFGRPGHVRHVRHELRHGARGLHRKLARGFDACRGQRRRLWLRQSRQLRRERGNRVSDRSRQLSRHGRDVLARVATRSCSSRDHRMAEHHRPRVDGASLTVSSGRWSGVEPITLSYRWRRCYAGCVEIVGATGQAYRLTAADVGFSLVADVTATNAGGATTESASTGPIAAAAPNTGDQPLIEGTPRAGQALMVAGGTWAGTAPVTLAYSGSRVRRDASASSTPPYAVRFGRRAPSAPTRLAWGSTAITRAGGAAATSGDNGSRSTSGPRRRSRRSGS